MKKYRDNVSRRISALMPELPSWIFAAWSAVFVTAANNGTLFEHLFARVDLHTAIGLWVALVIPFLITAITFGLFLSIGLGRILKPLIVIYLLIASVVGFYVDEYGVIFSEGMIRNMMDTVGERNIQEATDLVSGPLLLHIVLYGLLPALIVAVIKVRKQTPVREFASRLIAGSVVLILGAFTLLGDSQHLVPFAAKNRDLRHFITPLYAITSVEKYFRHQRMRDTKDFYELGKDAHLRAGHARKTLGILIIGETARADHFSLNGYARETNPFLDKEDIVSFTDTHSCGTATAVSVPCIFSLRDREKFDVESIRHESNVLDVLHKADVYVIWLDGNSGCKLRPWVPQRTAMARQPTMTRCSSTPWSHTSMDCSTTP